MLTLAINTALDEPPAQPGNCESALAPWLRSFVQQAAGSLLPVLLAGEFGTEKAQVALALHRHGPRAGGPFVAVRCAEPAAVPARWCRQASGGMLFLDGVDELCPDLQARLAQHLTPAPGTHRPLRVIASTTADLRERVGHGQFSRALLAALDYLCATVPPLRERMDEMEPLLRAALARHGDAAGQRCSDTLLAACRAHAWPENTAELDRVAARLVVMTAARPVGHAELLRHVPWLVAARGPALPSAAGRTARAAPPAQPEHWVRCAMNGDLAPLQALHPGVRKALLYLGAHYAEPVSLPQLASQAHVSASHLGFLLRSSLGATFKPLLQRIRVEKACQALAGADHRRITDVALSVGFGDLSHFEKSFRRVVGQSPREFQRGETGTRPGHC